MGSDTVKGREYLRVSRDTSGRERSPEEQHEDIAADAAARGWDLVTPAYLDTSSASRFARKARKGFDQLITDLQEDRFGADMLVLWESSRGSRKVSEWLTLIELCEERRVKIHVHLHHRTYDSTNPRDRRSLLEDAVDSEFEVAKTSGRVRRAMDANAVAGRPHGPAPLGYRRLYDHARKPIGQEIDPDEAVVVREVFRRVESGEALLAIAKDFAGRGITTRTGVGWSQQHLRKLLINPAYDGIRVHNGEQHPASWPRLIEHRQWLAVQRIMQDPARLTRRPGGAKYLLSLIAVCDVCSGPVSVMPAKGDSYMCRLHGHVFVERLGVDDLVLDLVADYLSDDGHYGAFAVRTDGELDRVSEQLAEARSEQDALAGLSAKLAAKMEPPILARIAELERREDELRTPSQLAGLLPPGKDMRRRLRAAPLSAQRTVMRLVLVPERLGELRILRSPIRGHRVASPRRIGLRVDEAPGTARLRRRGSGSPI